MLCACCRRVKPRGDRMGWRCIEPGLIVCPARWNSDAPLIEDWQRRALFHRVASSPTHADPPGRSTHKEGAHRYRTPGNTGCKARHHRGKK